MTEPFKLACAKCSFAAETPEQYIDHLLAAKHADEDFLATLRDSRTYTDFASELRTIQEHLTRGQMPPDAQRVAVDDLPNSVREDVESVRRRHLREYAARLTTTELVRRLDAIGDLLARLESPGTPSPALNDAILSVRAAALRLSELESEEEGITR